MTRHTNFIHNYNKAEILTNSEYKLKKRNIVEKHLTQENLKSIPSLYNLLVDDYRDNFIKKMEHSIEYSYKSFRERYKFYGVLDFKINNEQKKGVLMELLGSSLDVLISKDYDDKLNSDIIKKIFSDILKGVDYIHKRGYVHNDLKPDNILVSKPNKKIRKDDKKLIKRVISDEYILSLI